MKNGGKSMKEFIYYILYQRIREHSKELDNTYISTNKPISSEQDFKQVEQELGKNCIAKIVNCTLLK